MKTAEPAFPPPAAARTAPRSPLFQVLEYRVRQRLLDTANPRLAGLTVQGRYCGFVELTGVVPDLASKRQALLIAGSLSDVVDRIRVAPQAFDPDSDDVRPERRTRVDSVSLSRPILVRH